MFFSFRHTVSDHSVPGKWLHCFIDSSNLRCLNIFERKQNFRILYILRVGYCSWKKNAFKCQDNLHSQFWLFCKSLTSNMTTITSRGKKGKKEKKNLKMLFISLMCYYITFFMLWFCFVLRYLFRSHVNGRLIDILVQFSFLFFVMDGCSFASCKKFNTWSIFSLVLNFLTKWKDLSLQKFHSMLVLMQTEAFPTHPPIYSLIEFVYKTFFSLGSILVVGAWSYRPLPPDLIYSRLHALFAMFDTCFATCQSGPHEADDI